VRYALVHTGSQKVVNVLVLDAPGAWTPPAGHALVETETGGPGDTWNGSAFTPATVPSPAPTIAAGPALGTNPPAPSIDGDDRSGYITIGTGTSPVSGGVAATVTFAKPYPRKPIVILQGTTGAVVDRAPYVDIATIAPEGFQIRVRGALPAGIAPGEFLAYQVVG
jgi:hypothetical protein